MATKVRINKDFEERFETLMALSEESLTLLLQQIEKVDTMVSPEKLSERLYETLNISKKDLTDILNLVFSLNHLKQVTDFSSEKIADDLIEALQETESENLKSDHCKEYLLKVMSIEGIISTHIKASIVAANQEKLLLDTALITDIRPIFDGNEFRSSLIIHNLKIEYVEGENSHTIYLALDGNDLRKLKDSIKDAELREKSIKSKFSTTGITFINLEDD